MKNALRELRAERKWSQAHLADLLGVSRQNIIAIEKERYDPSLSLAIDIARLFDMPVEDIFRKP
ncbi:helix-turn-helix transcriptional regulator [Parvularcula oceani]|uniref:helix-turn-helix transcriptional regulator n=1 Tax=Parvularcula oceani TaxID=1247963 RepID=UPI0004E27FB6|nr:helix-turn-helix transcriptional regulator [Parvularcula oceani]